MFLNTLTVLAFAVGLFTTDARAEFAIASLETDDSLVGYEYQVNAELGRAWIALELHDHRDDSGRYQLRAKVPGLSYDSASKEIRLESETKKGFVTCAVLKKKSTLGIFKYTKFVETGHCGIVRIESVLHTVDDGFDPINVKRRVIYFGHSEKAMPGRRGD